MQRKIAILLATFNGSAYLRELIHSILAQKESAFTLYISDDDSSDDTPKILEEFAKNFPEKIILLHLEKRSGGACAHFLQMLAYVDADIYLFADQDDIWAENHLQKLLAAYEENNAKNLQPLLVFSDMSVIDASGNLLAPSFLKLEKLPQKVLPPHFYFVQNNISGCVMLFNAALKNLALHDEKKLTENLSLVPMHDAFLAVTAAEFGKIIFVHSPLLKYRKHAKNSLGVQAVTQVSHIAERFQKQRSDFLRAENFAAFFVEYFEKKLPEKERRILEKFSKISSQKKILRWKFLAQNGFLKAGIFRRIAQLIRW